MDLKNIAILALFTILLVEFGTYAIKLDINPKTSEETSTEPVHMTCLKDGSNDDDRHVKSVILKKGDEVLVQFYGPCKNAIFVNDTRQIWAIGNIGNKDSNSYFDVTLSNPKRGDTGTYTCNVYHTGKNNILHVDTAIGHLVVEKVDVTGLFTTLEARIKALDVQESDSSTMEFEALKREVRNLNTGMGNLQREIAELKKKDDENFTAFSATVHQVDKLTTTKDNILIFPHAITNYGSGYQTGTGLFEAPRHGMYVFTVVVCAFINRHQGCSDFDLDLMVSKADVKSTIAKLSASRENRDIDQSSISAVVELNGGDMVYCIMRDSNCKVENDFYSVFSGYIIKAL